MSWKIFRDNRPFDNKAMGKKKKQVALVCALTFVAVLLPYIGDVRWLGTPYLKGFFASQAYDELCLLVALGPVIYAAFILRVKGAIAVSIAETLAIFPAELRFSPNPDPVFRLASFAIASMLLGALIATELNRREHLREEHTVLQQFLAKNIDVQEREREYIARELHDEAAQMLVDVLHEIDELAEADKSGMTIEDDRLSHLRDQVEGLLETTRRFIKGLRPPLLEEMGLGAVLRWLAEESVEEQDIEINVDTDHMTKRLPDIQELNLFRIAQEALTNIRKHSQASKIWIKLATSGDRVMLKVQDNGVGFVVPRRGQLLNESKFGLIGIWERARLAGGDVKFESTPGRGTIVTVEAPIWKPK